MDSEIDFSTYTLDELYSSARAIDREAYPDRAKEIDDLIETREAQNPSENIVSKVAGEKATRSDRLVAAIVDGVLGVVCFIPVFILVGFDNLSQPTLTLSAGLLGYGILSTLVLHGYFMYQRAQTIGKSLMSIRIENLDGTQASFTTIYFKRMLCMQLLSLVPSVGQFIAGFVNPLFIFGKDKRCLHDHLAGTKVSYVD